MIDIISLQFKQVVIRRDGPRIMLVGDEGIVINLPWDAALELAKAIQIQARLAEEESKAKEIIYDQAILMRLGIPIGLSSRRDIFAAARHEAATNKKLRKYIQGKRAGGISSQAAFGKPTLILKEPINGL